MSEKAIPTEKKYSDEEYLKEWLISTKECMKNAVWLNNNLSCNTCKIGIFY